MALYEKIFEIVKQIPIGKVTTYGEIAKVIGIKSSARYVGWALNSNKLSGEIPAHRVVNRNGDLTGKMHFPTPHYMREMLESEGVTFKGDRVDMAKHLWKPEEVI
jgi:methylated-DNA-protein-cysteine methyltransferase-like protein